MSTRNIILKLDITSGVLTKLVDTNPIKENQYGDIYWLYAPYGTNVAKIKFFPQKFFDLTGVNPIPALKMFQETDEEVISAIIPEGDMETGWSAFYYPVGVGISGIVKSNAATQYDVSFQELEVDNTDIGYIGEYATVSTVDATVSSELDSEYPDAEESDYVNVYQTALTSSQYNSWQLIGGDVGVGTWTNQDELLNEQVTANTLTYRETFKATTLSNDDFNAGTPSEQALVLNQIYAELAELTSLVAALSGGTVSFMEIADYATEGTATLDVKWARNIRNVEGGDEASAIEIVDTVGRVNQDVKTTASPTFVAVNTDKIDFGTREITDNAQDSTLDVTLSTNVTGQMFQEELTIAKNNSASTIFNGQLVYISGSSGTIAQIELATNTVKAKAHSTIGMATEDITTGTSGFVTRGGLVRGINTSAYSAGDMLYLGVDGAFTNVKPTPPTFLVEIGIVVKSGGAGVGSILINIEKVHEIAEAPDVYNDSPSNGDVLKYNGTEEYYEGYDLENIEFVKTGWPVDTQTDVDIAFSGLTLTLTINNDTHYYINNVRYEIVAGDYTVDITDTSGAWYVYFTGDSTTLTSSQVVWDIRAGDKALVSEIYYNATTNTCVNCAYEFHSYEMSPVDHYHGHFTVATTVVNGLAVSPIEALQTEEGTVAVTQGKLMDEDIVIQILNGTLGSAKFTQPLTVLSAYKYYRLGASEIYRTNYDTNLALLDGGVPQLNPYDGSVYTLEDMQNNRYGAMWILYTTDVEAPVQIWTGQLEADSRNDAIELNGLDSMNFGSINIAEIRVAYRLIIRYNSGVYKLYQVDNFITDATTGLPSNPATSHGSLSGLLDDDHTQYLNEARSTTYHEADFLAKVDKDLSNDTTYPPITASAVADDDLANMYLDDNGTPKKMTLTEIYTGANAATGAFVASGDYSADGLTSNDSAFSIVHTMILNGTYQVYINIKDIDLGQMAKILLPTMTVDTALEISFDNQTTYRQLLVNGTTVPAISLSDKSIIVERTADGLIYTATTPLESSQSFVSVIDSTFGTIAPVNGGSPQITEIGGLSPNQVILNGDFASGDVTNWTASNIGTPTVTDNIVSFTATSANGAIYQTYDFIDGNKYFVQARVKADSSSVVLRVTPTNIASHSGGGNYEVISGILTASSNTLVMIRDERTSGWTQIDVDWIMVIPISNTSYSGQTADQLNAQFPTYLDNGYTDLVNPELKFYGKNLVNAKEVFATRRTSQLTPSGNVDITLNGTEFTVDNDTSFDGIGFYANVKANTAYYVSTKSTTANRGGVYYYDINDNEIGSNTASTTDYTFTTPSGTNYVRVVFASSVAGTFTVDEVQLEQGTTATDYTPYASPSDNFKLYGTAREVGDVRDTFEWNVDHYELVQRIGYYTLTEDDITTLTTGTNVDKIRTDAGFNTAIGATTWGTVDDNPIIVENYTQVSAVAWDSVGGESTFDGTSTGRLELMFASGTYASLAEAKTGLAGTIMRYELDSASYVTTEVDQDGSTYQEETTTIQQIGSFGTDYDITFALNKDKQDELDTLNIQKLQKGQDAHEVSIADIETDIETLEAKTDLITVTQAVDLDDMESDIVDLKALNGPAYTVLYDDATGKVIATSDSQSSATTFAISTYSTYDSWIFFGTSSGLSEDVIVSVEKNKLALYSLSIGSSNKVELIFEAEQDGSVLDVWNNRFLTTDISTGEITNSPSVLSLTIKKIIGIKY